MDFDSKFGDCVEHVEDTVPHTFANKKLCAESFNNAGPTASVYVADGQFTILPKNDRLAVYGDAVAASMLCRDWYDGGSSKGMLMVAHLRCLFSLTTKKAAWTAMRNNVLSNECLAEIGFTLGLDKYVNMDAGTTVVSKKMMATAVEALLGAVHLDGGDEALRRVLGLLRIVGQEERLVMFPILTVFFFMIQICYDQLTLTFIGLTRKDTKVAIMQAAQPCGAFDPSDRGVLGFKAMSGVIRCRKYGEADFALAREVLRPEGSNTLQGLAVLHDGTLVSLRVQDLFWFTAKRRP